MKTQSATGNALQKGAASRRARPETKNADHNINPIKIQEVKMGFTLIDGFDNNDDVEITGKNSCNKNFILNCYRSSVPITLSSGQPETITVTRMGNSWTESPIYVFYNCEGLYKPIGASNCSVGNYDSTHKRAPITITDKNQDSFQLELASETFGPCEDTTISVGETKPGESRPGGQSHKGYKKR